MSEIKHEGSDVCIASAQNQVSGIRTVTARNKESRVAEQGADPTPDLSGEVVSPKLHHWESRTNAAKAKQSKRLSSWGNPMLLCETLICSCRCVSGLAAPAILCVQLIFSDTASRAFGLLLNI